MQTFLEYFPILLLAVSTTGTLLERRWRWLVGFLALQYLAVFWLIIGIWPVGLASVKLVSGWMAAALLGGSQLPDEVELDQQGISWLVFRAAAAAFIWIVVLSLYSNLGEWIPASNPVLLGSSVLVGIGLLQLGTTSQTFRVIIGLLTVLSGFELLYAAVERSVLVTGMLAAVTLGLAFVGAFMMAQSTAETES